MSKKINTDDIANDLAGSLFFGKNARPVTSDSDENQRGTVPPTSATPRRTIRKVASVPPSTPDSSGDSAPASTTASTPASSRDISQASARASTVDSSAASTPDSKQARMLERRQANSLASTLASSGDLADAIYRVVKKTGKHVAYVRTTEREKSELTAVLEGISETHGYKVTETELIRIAICSLLADYAEKGSDSLLMRVVTDLKD
jgi:hypothetical protein